MVKHINNVKRVHGDEGHKTSKKAVCAVEERFLVGTFLAWDN